MPNADNLNKPNIHYFSIEWLRMVIYIFSLKNDKKHHKTDTLCEVIDGKYWFVIIIYVIVFISDGKCYELNVCFWSW